MALETRTGTNSTIPGPKGLPFLGVVPQIGNDPLKFFVNLMQEYGEIVQFNIGSRTMILLTDPAGIKYVLQDNNHNYGKGYDVTRPLIGNGLVTSEGDFWRKQRRLIQPMFHRSKIDKFSQVMVATAAEFTAGWTNAAAQGAEMDISKEMTRLTQHIIARTMFSTEVGDQTEMYMKAMEDGLEFMNKQLFNPIPALNKLPTPTNLRFKHSMVALDEAMYDLINQRRSAPGDTGDLLSMLLSARDEASGEGMSDQQIRDEVTTIFFAGHETTATALAWAWYVLSERPDVEQRLHAEIEAVLGDRLPAAQDYAELEYTRRFVDEVLRVYPPAWMFARTTLSDDEISGYHVPADTMLMISPYVTHRNPAYWERPDEFDPDRFLPERSEGRPKYAYIPFGGGPRLCIGRDFALVEATLILATIARRYRMHLAPGTKVNVQPIATLRPRPAVRVILEPR